MCSEQFKTPAKWSILELQTLGEGKAILNRVCVRTLYSLPKINFRDKPDWIKREVVPKVYARLEKNHFLFKKFDLTVLVPPAESSI